MYRKIQNENYFVDNFIKIMNNKFIHIFNNLNNENIPLTYITNQENNNQENNNQENNNQENNNHENNNQEINNHKYNKEVNNQENNNEENNQKNDKPLILLFIEDRLKNMEKKIKDASNKTFEKIFKIRFQNYLSDLQREQSLKNKEFGDIKKKIKLFKLFLK